MVYRYEHKISILEDLHIELSVKDVDIYDSALSKKLAQEEVDASLEFQRNHPEEYRRKNEERREFLNKMAERIKNNLLKYELSKKDNKWVKYRLLFLKNSRSNFEGITDYLKENPRTIIKKNLTR